MQSAVKGAAPGTSPRNLWEVLDLKPLPDLLNPNLLSHMSPGVYLHAHESEGTKAF